MSHKMGENICQTYILLSKDSYSGHSKYAQNTII